MTGQKRGQPHWRRVIKIELRVLRQAVVGRGRGGDLPGDSGLRKK